MHFFKVPFFLPYLFPQAIWRVKTEKKMIFLTFDDGPQEIITPWVLSLLEKEQIKAQFFAVGNNIIKNPEIALSIINQGHTLCNHTLNHKKGWSTNNDAYWKEIQDTEELIQGIYQKSGNPSPEIQLFRPPYGRIKPSQLIHLVKKGYRTIMWWQLSCDYDSKLNCKKSLDSLKRSLSKGSVVVFHDSAKAQKQIQQILPAFIEFAKESGFSFGLLTDELQEQQKNN